MRVAICDDIRSEQEQFIKALHGWDPSRMPECFSDGASFLAAAREPPHFDIAFLDIYLPGENGVDIAKELQKLSPETGIVFVTTSQEHAVDAFSLYALHYLVKPVTTQGIVEAFRRLALVTSKKRPMLTLTTGRGSSAVYQDEIYCLQIVNRVVEISLTDGRQIKVWMSLGELEQKLDGSFLRINRGTIVNMEQIEQMSTDTCMLRNGMRLEFSRRERASIRNAYSNYLFTRLSERKSFDREVLL